MLERYRTRDLPQGLEPLSEMALDFRWTWNHRADELWNQLDPVLWRLTRNPWLILFLQVLKNRTGEAARRVGAAGER